MKYALLSSLAAISLCAFAPRAEAGTYVRVFDGYDRCGHPVYVWVEQPSSHCSTYRRYEAPQRESYYSREYDRPVLRRDSCESSSRVYRSTPRFSFHFGF